VAVGIEASAVGTFAHQRVGTGLTDKDAATVLATMPAFGH
jgi:hypothetical protein